MATHERHLITQADLALAQRIAYGLSAHAPPWADRDELLGVAYLALVIASRRHDPARGPFAPFAALWVRGAVLRSMRYSARRPHALPIDEIWKDPAAPPLFADEGNPDISELRNAVAALPAPLWDVVMSYYWRGESIAAIARRLHTRDRAVRTLLTAAIDRLRDSLT